MLKTYFSPSIYSSNYHQMIILLFIFTFCSVTCCLSAAMFIKSLKSIFRQSDWSVFVTHHLHENNKGKGHCDFHGNAGVYSITENGDWIKVIKHACKPCTKVQPSTNCQSICTVYCTLHPTNIQSSSNTATVVYYKGPLYTN